MSEYKTMKISDLKPHPKNADIYGENEDVSDLVEKIKRSGQVHTLVVTSNNVVLAGHRRMRACKELGIVEVDVEIKDFDTPEQEIEYIIDNNATREKSNEQKAREALVLKQTLSAMAKKRKISKLKQNQSSDMPKMAQREEQETDMPKSAHQEANIGERGKTRDHVAKKVGFKSGHDVDRAIKTINKIDELNEEGRTEDAELLRGVMNNRGISAAENLAKNIDNVEIPQEARKDIQSGHKSPNFYIKNTVNKTEKMVHPTIESKKDEPIDNNDNLVIELSEIQKRYSDYLSAFQKDIEWLLGMEFYKNDEEISGKAHSDLQNCFEKFKSISEMMQRMSVDEFGSITIN